MHLFSLISLWTQLEDSTKALEFLSTSLPWEKSPTDDHVTSRTQDICPFQNLSVQRVRCSFWWLKPGDFLVLPIPAQRWHSINICWMNGRMTPPVTSLHPDISGWQNWCWAEPWPSVRVKGKDKEGCSDSFCFRNVASYPHGTRQLCRQKFWLHIIYWPPRGRYITSTTAKPYNQPWSRTHEPSSQMEEPRSRLQSSQYPTD